MIIRTAQESDYEQLIQLYNKFVGEDRYSQKDADSFLRVLKNPSNYVFVADDNGILAGFAAFSVRDVVRYSQPIAELDEIFVDDSYRKQGVGKKLMLKVEDQARKKNCYRLYVESHYDHAGAHLYYAGLEYTNYGYHFVKNL